MDLNIDNKIFSEAETGVITKEGRYDIWSADITAWSYLIKLEDLQVDIQRLSEKYKRSDLGDIKVIITFYGGYQEIDDSVHEGAYQVYIEFGILGSHSRYTDTCYAHGDYQKSIRRAGLYANSLLNEYDWELELDRFFEDYEEEI